VTLTPSVSISEEYNDNIFSNNANRQWDFITGVTPALTLVVNQPTVQLSAGYSLSADIYARNYDLSKGLNRQNLVASGSWAAAEGLTLFASDRFAYDYNTNVLGSQGFSTGRQEGWSNNVTAGMTWQVTRSNSLNLNVGYDLFRFRGDGDGVDSDTYSLQAGITHDFSPRLSSYVNYAFSYIDAQGQDSSMTHSPTLGLSYQFTQTITGRVSGGAGITTGLGGDVDVSPVISASLEKTFKAGSVSASYSRTVEVASGFGGPTDSQTVSGSLILTALLRGAVVVFTPAYRIAQSVDSQQVGQIDVKALTLTLAATYQLFQYVSIFGDYEFFQQRTSGSSTSQLDVDQHRVRFGLQFGYPIRFD
jgi:predicted porin